MGSLSFVDPVSGQKVELKRDSENPFYASIKAFREAAPISLCFVSDGAKPIAGKAYVFPAEYPLVAVPAIQLMVVPSGAGGRREIRGWLGFFNQSRRKEFPLHRQFGFPWIGDVWREHLAPLLYDDLHCSYLNYLAAIGRLDEFDRMSDTSGPLEFVEKAEEGTHPHPGRSKPTEEPEFRHLVYLKVCLAWPRWEAENVPWKARTAEATEMGICRKMDEDNFRDICKKAGLLVPRQNKKKAAPGAARKRR